MICTLSRIDIPVTKLIDGDSQYVKLSQHCDSILTSALQLTTHILIHFKPEICEPKILFNKKRKH